MQVALSEPVTLSQQDRDIAATVRRERGRLLAYIRRWIADAAEAEDIVQESLYELVLAYRMMQPVEQAGAWLARVARNRIIDRFRRKGARPGAAELPAEQREVFIAQELDGVSFRELAQRSGVSINTLLSRKRYAVRFLRARLQAAWREWLMR